MSMGVFAQHQWTLQRMTLTYGGRYDYFLGGFPEQQVGPALLAPTRNLTFPENRRVARYHDISPRLGVAYDLFGTGKTAIKATFGKYPESAGGTLLALVNPAANLVTSTNRSWTDANGNFVPDCNLLNARANGECGPIDNAAFGAVADVAPGAVVGRGGVVSVSDPDMLQGWGRREYFWGWTAGVQHELFPRVSAEVSYDRRSYRNHVVTQNRATTAADYDPFSITAPVDPRLPGGGGFVIDGLFDIKPEKFGQVDNFITRASNIGKKIEVLAWRRCQRQRAPPGGRAAAGRHRYPGGPSRTTARSGRCWVIQACCTAMSRKRGSRGSSSPGRTRSRAWTCR